MTGDLHLMLLPMVLLTYLLGMGLGVTAGVIVTHLKMAMQAQAQTQAAAVHQIGCHLHHQVMFSMCPIFLPLGRRVIPTHACMHG